MASILDTMGLNPLLQWLSNMIQLYEADTIKVPNKFDLKVTEVKNLLKNDVSGLVNSILDFAINCASSVKYTIETDNSNLTKLLNNWLDNINYSLKGKIPVGLNALAKEYFRERWKGSSLLLLRTLFEKTEDDYLLPSKLWFVNGEDVIVEDDKDGVRVLGEEKYYLKTKSKDKKKSRIPLPNKDGEYIFVQKPFSSWSELEPEPFIIQRGLYKNLKLLELLESKGEFVINKALEYLMVLKKGSERLALTGKPEFIYNEEDYKNIREELANFIKRRKTEQGLSVYTTGFDTEIEHLIPEYGRILAQELYTPIERRILAGLGVIEILQGIGTTRRESIFNPKPFISEIEAGINDFKTLLKDIILTMVELNRDSHPKYFSKEIHIHSTPVKQFIDENLRTILRSLYDRGLLSKRTAIEVLGTLDYNVEKTRRQEELKNGDLVLFYPYVIQNQEQQVSPEEELIPLVKPQLEDQNKTGPEKLNYTQSKVYEEAPYKNIKDLPDNVKNVMPKSLQKIWMEVFNKSLDRYGNEDIARKVAWQVIKNIAIKDKNGKWKRKEKSSIDIDKFMSDLESQNE